MDKSVFTKILRACQLLPDLLIGKLFVLADEAEPSVRADIAEELCGSAQRQLSLVQAGLGSLHHEYRLLRKQERNSHEQIAHAKDVKHLPGFDHV